MSDAKSDTKPDADVEDFDFELVTNVRQLAAPPPLRKEAVTLTDWKTTSGKAARFLAWELTAADYAEFVEAGWVYKDGARKRYKNEDEDVRFLAYALRDQHGSRLWNKVEDANAQLGRLGKGSINLLLAAVNRMNAPKEAAKAGNSEEIQSDS